MRDCYDHKQNAIWADIEMKGDDSNSPLTNCQMYAAACTRKNDKYFIKDSDSSTPDILSSFH